MNDPISRVDPSGLITCTGSRINTQSCANSAVPNSCSGNCGEYYGIVSATPLLAPQPGGSGGLYSLIEACAKDASVCLLPIPEGALATGGQGGGNICIAFCETRGLTPSEKAFYHSQGLSIDTVTRAILANGLPLFPYADWSVRGYTVGDVIYLRHGIGSAFSSPDFTGLIGHELYHVWQYSTGVLPTDFAVNQMIYGPHNSPLEIPAYNFGWKIQTCRTGGWC